MAKTIDSMSNYELVAIAKALADCETFKADCISCPCCGVICCLDNTDQYLDARDTLICELGIRMTELMNVN